MQGGGAEGGAGAPIDVVQGVVVLGVVEDGDDVHVDLFGGDQRICASVRFTFVDAVVRAKRVRTLERWCHEGRAVTLSTTPTSIRIQDDAATLGRQLGLDLG